MNAPFLARTGTRDPFSAFLSDLDSEDVARAVASDLVSYIVLDGVVRYPDGRRVGAGALLYAESLVGVLGQGDAPVCEQTTRLLRVRADDFAEICSDPRLASELYRRLAMHLARLGATRLALPEGANRRG